MGAPPTRRPIALEVICLVTVVGGKVTEIRSQFDQVGLLREHGQLPSG